jgi:HEAT repeat protein
VTGPRISQFQQPSSGPAITADDDVLPIPPALLEEALKLLSKAVRARLLYLPNNPNYAKAAELWSAVLAPFWQHAEECVLTVQEHQFLYGTRSVYREEETSNDSLPWLLFKDGVRELRLLPGFEGEESGRFLDLLVQARKAMPEEDDLLTLLWQGEFQFLRYRFVDVGVEGAGPLEYDDGQQLPSVLVDSWGEPPRGIPGGGPSGADGPDGDMPDGAGVGGAGVGDGMEGKAGAGGASPDAPKPHGVVSLADFDQTLYFLDDNEIEYLREEIRKEYARDERTNVVAMLLDIFELQSDPLVREEICGILDGYILQLLSAAQFQAVAYLLREAQGAVVRARDLDATHRQRVSGLADRLSDAETLGQLLQGMDDAPELPPQADLTELFNQLRPTALRTVFAWSGRLSKPPLRQLLESAAGVLASQNTNDLVRLIGDQDRLVALEAARRAGALRTAAAVAPLAKLLADPGADLRLAAVQGLAEIASPGALQQLERMLDDTEREVRLATARTLAAKAYRPALPRLEGIIKGKALRDRDVTEKMALFEAYGAMAGEPGIPLLDGLLNGKGFLGRREDADVRACAAVALGRIGTPKAMESLRKAAGDAKDEVVVRTAVNKALRGGAA